ncbi:AraC family transcriptional regulator [Paenibacillus abyssi]|uniref:AraC family transcriptional regulator n=1 Tax=Paenibacillus abyssi TaxID=1340531 RepID=A0A917CQU6_9BACL|nr:AraC family transcriptional regulator [Paenibacillus abyssi]GGF95668.1 AraC family transcriptional regulator [Paenibacillus abyssi]
MHKEFTYSVVSNPVSIEHGSLNVLFAGESQTKPSHKLGPKVYDFYLLHHVLSGEGTFTCRQTDYRIRAGQSFIIEPEQLVSYASDESDPWHYRWVAFAGTEAANLVHSVGFGSARPIADTGRNRRIGVLLHSIQQAFRRAGNAAHLQAAGYLQLLLAEFGDAMGEKSEGAVRTGGDGGEHLIQQVVHYLSTQYAEPVSMERMAQTLGYNRAYLSRIFKLRTGMSPVTFLLKLRIDKARQLLRERLELTVEQIAASVGFQDPLYFSKQFRRFYGLPPTAYRESMRTGQLKER